MPFLELFDETLDINATENYELSVQVSPFEVSFTILDTLRNKFVMLRSYEPGEESRYQPSQIEAIIRMDDFLTRQFKKRNILATSSKVTLIPGTLYDESKKKDCFRFNHLINERDIVISNKVDNPDLYIVFSIPDEYVGILNSSFRGNEIIHQLKPLFYNIYNVRKPVADLIIHVHLEDEYLNLIISDQSNIKFCNSFNYQSLTEIQYYVLYVFRRMNIRFDELIQISGRGQKRDEITRGFSGYFSNMRFAEPTGNYTLSYVFNEVELYRYLNIFSIVSCV
jgi:hypothetical protein